MPRLWDALFGKSGIYTPSPTVEFRIDREEFDLDEIQAVLEFVTDVIREERLRIAAAQASEDNDGYEQRMEFVWPDAA